MWYIHHNDLHWSPSAYMLRPLPLLPSPLQYASSSCNLTIITGPNMVRVCNHRYNWPFVSNTYVHILYITAQQRVVCSLETPLCTYMCKWYTSLDTACALLGNCLGNELNFPRQYPSLTYLKCTACTHLHTPCSLLAHQLVHCC